MRRAGENTSAIGSGDRSRLVAGLASTFASRSEEPINGQAGTKVSRL